MSERIELIVQGWEESEAGWGQRPDGYSVHLTEADRLAYIQAYWDRMPSAVPAEYERPCGTPYRVPAIQFPDAILAALPTTENGVRSYDRAPVSGPDGWGSTTERQFKQAAIDTLALAQELKENNP